MSTEEERALARAVRLRQQVPGGIIEIHGQEILIEGIFTLAELRAIVAVMEEAGEEER